MTTVRAITSVGTYLKSEAEEFRAEHREQHTSRDDLLKEGNPSMDQLIRNLSEVSGVQETGDARGQNVDGYGVRTINLRNLGAGRTMILFDGVRLADDPLTNGGPAVTFDPNVEGGGEQNVNNIPMEVLAQVEVLKDLATPARPTGAMPRPARSTLRLGRDLNGFEASVDYKYVANTDGDYDANIQWGKRQGSQNILFSAYYSHQSALAARDRKITLKSFNQNQYDSGYGDYDANFMAEVFAAPGIQTPGDGRQLQPGQRRNHALRHRHDHCAGRQHPVRGLWRTNDPVLVAGAGTLDPTQGQFNGVLRDDQCIAEGGVRTWTAAGGAASGTASGPAVTGHGLHGGRRHPDLLVQPERSRQPGRADQHLPAV